jgi:hypothetical protein
MDVTTDPVDVPEWEKHHPPQVFLSIDNKDFSHVSLLGLWSIFH